MNILDRLRAAWRSFVSSFDYVPPPAPQQTEAADTQVMTEPLPPPAPAAFDDATRLELARIATAGRDELPQIVTRQTTDWTTGETTVTRQDGTPLTVIERAIMARQDELRRQAGG